MKRLTEKEYSVCIDCPGIGCCSIDCEVKKLYDRLAEYEDMEEQGLLLKIPCKVGDTLYDISEFVDGEEHPEMYEDNVHSIELSKNINGRIWFDCGGTNYFAENFGRIVFTSREAAEKALEALEEV